MDDFYRIMPVESFKEFLNKGGPPSKPKYASLIDSEQVPWGKGEKNPKEGVKKNSEI